MTRQQVNQHRNDHMRKCGCKQTLHTLRHQAGTQGGELIENLRLVQDFFGHAN